MRRLVDDRELSGDAKHRFRWDGRDDDGAPVPDGLYRMRVVRRDEGRVIDSLKEIKVDRRPPRAELLSAHPSVIAPGEPGRRPRCASAIAAHATRHPCSACSGPTRVPHAWCPLPRRAGALGGLGRPPARGTARAGGGLRLHGPGARPSRQRDRGARAGAERGPRQARNRGVGSPVHAFGAALRRAGRGRGAPAGGSIRPLIRLRPLAPRQAAAGGQREEDRWLVPGSRPASHPHRPLRCPRPSRRPARRRPLAVAGLPQKNGSAGRPRPLVVLPALSWLGRARVDDDHDGFADSLPKAARIPLAREFPGGALPPGLRSDASPLLRFLDREGLTYDLTTDLSLARGDGPALGNATGVAFAGAALWLPPDLLQRLRRYVDGGGRLASFGADAFRRGVHLGRDAIGPAARPAPANVFGERTALLHTGEAPLSVFQDDLGLFDGLTGLIGDFTLFERSAPSVQRDGPGGGGRTRAGPAGLRGVSAGPRPRAPQRHPAMDPRARRGATERGGAHGDEANLAAPLGPLRLPQPRSCRPSSGRIERNGRGAPVEVGGASVGRQVVGIDRAQLHAVAGRVRGVGHVLRCRRAPRRSTGSRRARPPCEAPTRCPPARWARARSAAPRPALLCAGARGRRRGPSPRCC